MRSGGAPICHHQRSSYGRPQWCPASHPVRQRLTELGLSFVAHQVPVEPDARLALERTTGQTTVPVLVAGGEIIAGEQAIVTHRALSAEAAEREAHAARVDEPRLGSLVRYSDFGRRLLPRSDVAHMGLPGLPLTARSRVMLSPPTHYDTNCWPPVPPISSSRPPGLILGAALRATSSPSTRWPPTASRT